MVILRIELENDVIQCDTRAINNFYDLKKSIYEADNIIIKHFTCDDGEKIHLYNLLEDYQDKKITAIRDYTEYEFTGKEQEKMRCVKCRGFFSDVTINFKHSSKCRKGTKEIINPNKNKHQINSFSLSRIEVDDHASPFTSVEITLDKKSDEKESDFFQLDQENKTSNSSNILQHSPSETKSEIKECAVANALKDMFNIKNETKNEKKYSKSLLESSNFSWPSNLKNDDNILKNFVDSTQADSTQIISLNEPQNNDFTSTATSSGENCTYIVLSKDKNNEIFNFYKDYFPKIEKVTIDSWVETCINIGYYMNNNLGGLITFNIYSHAEVNFAYVKLMAVDEKFRKKGIGRGLLNQVKNNYCKKIILWADNKPGTLRFYTKCNFFKNKTLGRHLQSIMLGCRNAKVMYSGFNKKEKLKFRLLFEETHKKQETIKDKNKRKIKRNFNKKIEKKNIFVDLR